jgi:MYXO-CTERM domain-containing protein
MLISLKTLKKPTTLLSLAAALGMSAMVGQAQAVTVLTSTNLLTAFSGETLSPVAGFPMITVDMYEPGSTTVFIATLKNCVFQDTGVGDADYGQYIYEETLTPNSLMSNQLGAFNTTFTPLGFTAGTSKIGWNYSAGTAAGGTGTSADFVIYDEPSGNIKWNNDVAGGGTDATNGDYWNTGDAVTFFYESVDGPGTGGYTVQNTDVGANNSYAPVSAVPVPAAASMGLVALAGLAGFGLLRRRMAAV